MYGFYVILKTDYSINCSIYDQENLKMETIENML